MTLGHSGILFNINSELYRHNYVEGYKLKKISNSSNY